MQPAASTVAAGTSVPHARSERHQRPMIRTTRTAVFVPGPETGYTRAVEFAPLA